MFDRLSTGEKVIGSIVGALAIVGGIITPAVIFGEVRSDVKTLQRDYGKLEERVNEIEKPRPRTAKGELCGKLFDGMVDASRDSISGESRQKPLLETAEKMDCFEGVPAMAIEPEGSGPDEEKP